MVEEGVGLIGEALTYAETSEDRWCTAELHRLRGELLLLAGSQSQEVEDCYRLTLTVARAQGARLWELRGAVGLARLWRDQSKRKEARDLLAPVYAWFTEGLDIPDLKEAGALLAELGRS